MSIQVQNVPKTQPGSIDVTFATPFTEPPVVIVTPVFGSGVVCVETVTNITTTGCTITSNNAALDYSVNVLAATLGRSNFGNLVILANNQLKNKTAITVNLPSGLTSPDPVTLLTSYWQNSTIGVGCVDTIDDLAASEFSVYSNNAATNYYTQYLCSNVGIGSVGNCTLQTGIANKTGQGTLRVYFTQPFNNPPTVLLSSWWNDANGGVSVIDTLCEVTANYFEVVSNNAATNYFTTWMAFGT